MNGTIKLDPVITSAQKAQIANLIYEGDRRFAPVTPLATLNTSTTFFSAKIDGTNKIRGATSYEHWLAGCDETYGRNCDVYELASSIVRSPLGGFKPPSRALHHVFTFARLADIITSYLSPESAEKKVSIVASIAANNDQSRNNMTSIGMVEINPWPRWLEYEHRSWFPKLNKEERKPEQEAVYLWFPPQAIRTFMVNMEPYVTGKMLLERDKEDEPAVRESYGVKLDGLLGYEDLIGRYNGSISQAVNDIPYDQLFADPPALAKLNEDTPGQAKGEIVF